MARRSLISSDINKDIGQFNRFLHRFENLFEDVCPSRHFPLTAYEERFLAPVLDVDICENENTVTVAAELPGLEEKDINIEYNDNCLTISGQKEVNREEKDKNFSLIERSSGSFSRSMQMPTVIDEDKIHAKFKNGVLTITLPKSAESKARAKHIQIQKG